MAILSKAKKTIKKINKQPQKTQHLFRNSRVQEKQKEGWKIIEVRNDLTLMEK